MSDKRSIVVGVNGHLPVQVHNVEQREVHVLAVVLSGLFGKDGYAIGEFHPRSEFLRGNERIYEMMMEGDKRLFTSVDGK